MPAELLSASERASLKARYDAARALAIAAKDPHAETFAGICPYCCQFWRKWVGSKLDGHSKCVVPQAFKDSLKSLFASIPALTYHEVSSIIDISPAVLRSWVAPIRR